VTGERKLDLDGSSEGENGTPGWISSSPEDDESRVAPKLPKVVKITGKKTRCEKPRRGGGLARDKPAEPTVRP